MNKAQQTALEHHCRLAFETAQPRFAWYWRDNKHSLVLTVNSGWE